MEKHEKTVLSLTIRDSMRSLESTLNKGARFKNGSFILS